MFEEYPKYEYPIAAFQLSMVMMGMGAKLGWRDFLHMAKRPKSLAIGLVCQWIVIPLLAVGFGKMLGLGPGLAFGFVLVAAMPGGPMSTLYTHFGGGNAPLAIAMTAITTLASLVTVPLLLEVFGGAATAAGVAMPLGEILREIGLFLFLPLVAGMAIAENAPKIRGFVARWGMRLGTMALLVIVAGSLGSGRVKPMEHGAGLLVWIIVFCVVSQQLSMIPFRIFKLPGEDRLAVGIEMTIRDINLALLLKASLFPAGRGDETFGNAVLFVTLCYGGTALVAGAITAVIFRFVLHPRERKPQPV